MPRIATAVIAELVLVIAYLQAALRLSDFAVGWHWALQLPFYAVVGIAWVFPTRWLMLWAARKRG